MSMKDNNLLIKLTKKQKEMLFMEQKSQDQAFFNIPIALSIRGALNLQMMKKSFKMLLEKHEILRLKINKVNEDISGYIADLDLFDLEYMNLNASDQSQDINSFVAHIASKKFDLLRGQLIRANLIHMDSNSYILLIVIHHIITDQWSNQIIINDMQEIYNSLWEGECPYIVKPDYNYFAFLETQKEQHQASLKYWLEHLQNTDFATNIHRSTIRLDEFEFKGNNYHFEIPSDKAIKLKNYAKSQKTTIFNLLFSILASLIYKYSNKSTFAIGCSSANRLHEDSHDIIGYFVDILPIIVNIDQNTKFNEFLKANSRNLLDAYAHQDFTFSDLLQKLEINNNQSSHPIYQVLFAMNYDISDTVGFKGTSTEAIELTNNIAKNELSIFCKIKKNGNIGLLFNYSSQLFTVFTIDILVSLLIKFADYIVDNSEAVIDQFPLINKNQANDFIRRLNKQTIKFHYKDLRVENVFTEICNKNPNTIAIIDQNTKSWTFQEIDNLSNKWADHLTKLNYTAKDRIAISLAPGIEIIISMLAIAKIGATFILINVEDPIQRRKNILSDSNAKAMIANEESELDIPIINLHLNSNLIFEDIPNLFHANKLENDNLCIVYTSGSTAQPKGVLYSHHSICNRAIWLIDKYPYINEDISIILANISFVDYLTEVFMPLLNGSTILLLQSSISKDLDALLSNLKTYNVSRLNITPSLLEVLIERLNYSNIYLPKLRHLEVSGELFTNKLTIKTIETFKKTKIVNRYGSTEATAVIYNDISLDNNGKIISKSNIIANTQIYVLDKHHNLLPPGIVGEIYVKGAAVSMGYNNLVDVTQKKFIQVVNLGKHNKLYKTGDLGYTDKEDNIIVVGRDDSQIKIRGHRVDLQEIEKVALNFVGIKDVKAFCKQNKIGENIILLYVITLDFDDLSELKNYLKNNLPNFMLPYDIIGLKEFPLNKNGKIDLIKLQNFTNVSIQRDFAVPRNIKEYKLLQIFKRILKTDDIDIKDNFFSIGGNSILAIRLVAEIQKQLNLNISIYEFYKNPNVKYLARYNGKKENSHNISSLLQFKNTKNYRELITNDKIVIPVTANRYSYFLKRKHNLEFWNISSAFELKIKYKKLLIVEASKLLFEHHVGLDLRVFLNSKFTIQQFIPKNKNTANLIDFPTTEHKTNTQKYKIFVEREVNKIQHSFSFPNRMFKILVIESTHQNPTIIFIIHHLLVDLVSNRSIIKNFFYIYSSLIKKRAPKLTNNSTTFLDYSAYSIFYWDKYLQLNKYAQNYWDSLAWNKLQPISIDFPGRENLNIEDYTKISIRSIDSSYIHNGSSNKALIVLLCAIGLAYRKWTGNSVLSLNLLFSGRENFHDKIDLIGTEGYFVEFIPIIIEVENNLENFYKKINDQVKYANLFGKSYGIGKYLTEDKKIKIALANILCQTSL